MQQDARKKVRIDIPSFERQQPVLQQVELKDIAPWSTSGAKSATGKAIAALSFTSTVLLRRLPGAGAPTTHVQRR